ncbi:MAG: tRNA (adenosine(37)-N6)-threonylcarbamoyltransferase complex dimerization subunit type 1 TsaB [Thermogutta sp.]|nr:tRNA (adenosine(37)-N6)-threonylcarbamoyltransferase complex dimerization subunit type 1 TsaB [Thermogutta sp.]
MYTLALETTDAVGSVALFREGECLDWRWLPDDRRSAQTLAPAVRDLLRDFRVRPNEIGLVGVSVGPGSFTGIRIGLVTAKTFAYAVRAAIIGIDTLEAIAAGVSPDISRVAVMADAQRGDIVGKLFERQENGTWPAAEASRPQKPLDWLSTLPASDGLVVAGPGALRFKEILAEHGYRPAPDELCRPKAFDVGRLAWTYYGLGRRDDLWKLMPRYFRPSYAEEKAAPASPAQL